MNLSDEFWKRAEEVSVEDVAGKVGMGDRTGVGIDLYTRSVVLVLDGNIYSFDIEYARALAVGITLAADALQQRIAESN